MTDNLEHSFATLAGGLGRLESNFNARSFHPERRARQAVEGAAASTREAHAKIAAAAQRLGLAPDDPLIGELEARWNSLYRRAWSAYQAAGARVLNWAITGPARFPVERNRKRMETEHKRLGEMLEIENRVGAWAEKQIKRAIRERLGPIGVADAELDQARAKVARLERRQAMMTAANKAIRRHKAKPDAAAAIAAELAGAGFAEVDARVAAELLKPDFCGRVGFAAYQLSNNGAEIRRMKGRVAQLERRAATIVQAINQGADRLAPPELEPGAAPRIVEDQVAQRVRIYFAGKPPAAIRDRLKGRGFRWSPTAGAWQRQLTRAAVDAARAIVNQH